MNMHATSDSDALPDETETPDVAKPAGKKHRIRKRLLLLLAVVSALGGGSWWAYETYFAANVVATENAYTAVEIAQVTPLVGGPVAEVLVVETQAVTAGQILVRLDDADAQLALAAALADRGRAERQVRQLFATVESMAGVIDGRSADIASAEADVIRARADLEKAELDASRRRQLAASGTISRETLANTETALNIARASLQQATARLEAARAARVAAIGTREASAVLIAATDVENHPEVKAAQARLDQARLNLERTVIRAPVKGIIAQRNVEVGERVQPGQRLMAVVPIERIYVNANFKEGQLSEVVPGQAVHLVSDLYGDKVVYHGRVIGFAGGSGSAFAAIPAQNATGNWIKVVQRLPVRIELDPAQLRAHPLRVGLSMHATVDLASPPEGTPVAAVEARP
jgi:membrane fusion protein (multidrug efflux system)